MQPNHASRDHQPHKFGRRHHSAGIRWPGKASIALEQPQDISGAAVVLEKRSKAELYRCARALDFHGRSYMSKGRLVLVIRNRLSKINILSGQGASLSGTHGRKADTAFN